MDPYQLSRAKGFDLNLARHYAKAYLAGFTEGNDEALYPDHLGEAERWVRKQGYHAGVTDYCDTIDDNDPIIDEG
jgi:hypothetical protein